MADHPPHCPCSNVGSANSVSDSVFSLHALSVKDLTEDVTRDNEIAAAVGSFADIFKGTLHSREGITKVAIKVIRICSTDEEGSPKIAKQLQGEIRVWSRLKHTNVLPLIGTTLHFSHFPAMVCPWAENGTLTSYLEGPSCNLTAPTRLALIDNVAAGLRYLHFNGIVHCDLSGSNVLIDMHGRALLADFGLSATLEDLGRSIFVTSRMGRGTSRWAAPELLGLGHDDTDDSEPKIVPTKASDIYAFGSIMLQILSGRVPYHYYSRNTQILGAIMQGKTPKRPFDLPITARQWSFIQQCWSSVELRPSIDEAVRFIVEEFAMHSQSQS